MIFFCSNFTWNWIYFYQDERTKQHFSGVGNLLPLGLDRTCRRWRQHQFLLNLVCLDGLCSGKESERQQQEDAWVQTRASNPFWSVTLFPDTQTLQRLHLTRKKNQSSSSSSNVPRGTWWDVPARCIFTEYLPYNSWLHKTGTQKSFISLSACASLEPPHCMCCAQHTWQDGLLQKVSFVERKTEGHPPFPPLRALLRFTPQGLIICAKIRQPALAIIFWRGGRTWEVLLGRGSSWRIWSTRKGFSF